jgi:MoaA/NifB/PqqE/SkfB family radical SAM enzyme
MTGLNEGFMDLDLVKKVANEFQHQASFMGVLFALYGEPLMNRSIVEMVQAVKAAGKRVQITTNGLLLTDELSRKLMDNGLDKIKISFQGTTEKEYAFWRNNPYYKKIICQIENLLELRAKLGVELFVQIGTSVANDSDEEISAFMDFWKDRVDNVYYDATGMLHLSDQPYVKGKTFRHQAVRRTSPCFDIFMRMSVLHNGQVPLCVDDEEHVMGDLYTQSIEEIWKCKGFEAHRYTILKDGNVLSPCKYCYTSPRPHKSRKGEAAA